MPREMSPLIDQLETARCTHDSCRMNLHLTQYFEYWKTCCVSPIENMWSPWIGMCIHFVAFLLTVIILGTGINGRAFEHLHSLFVWLSTLLLIPHIFDYLLCLPSIYLAAAAGMIYPSALSAWLIESSTITLARRTIRIHQKKSARKECYVLLWVT